MFLLARQDRTSNRAVVTLYRTIAQLPKPLDLWVVNFSGARNDLNKGNNQSCVADSQRRPKANGDRCVLLKLPIEERTRSQLLLGIGAA